MNEFIFKYFQWMSKSLTISTKDKIKHQIVDDIADMVKRDESDPAGLFQALWCLEITPEEFSDLFPYKDAMVISRYKLFYQLIVSKIVTT